MTSYRARVKELEDALRGIRLLVSGPYPSVEPKEAGVAAIVDHVLQGGTVEGAGVMLRKWSAIANKEVLVALGTPIGCDLSSETYWSM